MKIALTRGDTLVLCVCGFLVDSDAHHRELCLYLTYESLRQTIPKEKATGPRLTWLDLAYPDGSVDEFAQERTVECGQCMLGRAVD